MIPYSRALIVGNGDDYGVVKTETVFGFTPSTDFNITYNSSDPLAWIFGSVGLESSLQESARTLKGSLNDSSSKNMDKSDSKKQALRKSKHKKCVYKLMNKNKGIKKMKGNKMQKKYLMPLILGVLAAKSVLIPIALKALAFMSAKGLVLGFFSTVMASVLSLKGMFDNTQRYQDRRDEKTQVEIIQVPMKTDDHYYDEHYKRYDHVPAT
ncbi:hypothetical protein EVAR_12314_1 [Eumeta japonica]|uniref:Uncharacterized protein n=1 Tax=Eumeta variegata TaxID=151549 RepID=A0A4C1TUM9_EUMVA|nr:hypothetical protein EVAR_12314_1 [Eumeta japonica]